MVDKDLLEALGAIGSIEIADIPPAAIKYKVKDVRRILENAHKDMLDFNAFAHRMNYGTPNVDRAYHTKAMYDATDGNFVRGLIALGGGLYKEYLDMKKYTKDRDFWYALKESAKDMGNNINGVWKSWMNPYLPSDEHPKIKNLQTPTMRDIMPLYGALKNDKKD